MVLAIPRSESEMWTEGSEGGSEGAEGRSEGESVCVEKEETSSDSCFTEVDSWFFKCFHHETKPLPYHPSCVHLSGAPLHFES